MNLTFQPPPDSGTGGVKIGHSGDWHDISPGMKIGDGDFVKIPAGDSVSVTMPDGRVKEFNGQSVIPGEWVNSDYPSIENVYGPKIMHGFEDGMEQIVGKVEKTKGNG